MGLEDSWATLDKYGIVLGILSAVFAFMAMIISGWQKYSSWREKTRKAQEVVLLLQSPGNDKKIQIPFALRRGEIIRSEILGLIGMLPMKTELKRFRYEIHYLSTNAFREEMSRLQDSTRETELKIICTEEELNQFDMEKFYNDNRD